MSVNKAAGSTETNQYWKNQPPTLLLAKIISIAEEIYL